MMEKAVKSKIRIGSRTFDIVNAFILILLGFITLYPMYYIAIVSISSAQHIARGDIAFIPKGVNFDAYKIVFQNKDIWRAYVNTITYTVLGTGINILMTALCAFPLSRKEFFGRRFFSFIITLTMFIGGGMIPLYLVVNELKMINTMWAIVLPGAISTYNMIIMRTFFSNIPDSLYESAHLDGANDIRILISIVMPLSMPIIATLTLFYAVSHWNSYFPALLYLNEKIKYPVQVIMRDIVIAGEFSEFSGEVTQSTSIMSTNYKYAVIIISVIPILIVYPFLQKHFAKGVMIGAVKG